MPEIRESGDTDREEDIFMILSHPVRRRILQEMFEEGSISFTTMSKEWGLSTGVIYHHLKLLKPLITQDNKKYVLTEKGYEVCEWFLKTKAGRVKVEKISFFNQATYVLFYFLAQHKYPVIFSIMILWGVSAYLATGVDAVILGPLFFAQAVVEGKNALLMTSFFGTLAGIVLNIVFLVFIGKKPSAKFLASFLFSLLLSALSVMLLFAFNYANISTPHVLWFALIILAQVWFIVVNTLGLANYYSVSLEKSALFSVVLLYFYLFVSFVLLSI